MAHPQQRNFCEKVKSIYPQFFKNKKVLDIGSLDINGCNRDLFEDCNYIGIDLGEGRNVDFISSGNEYQGPDNYFDTIISTEVFEHDMHYPDTIQNIIRMLKPGGLFVFTCAANGRPEHGTRRTDLGSAPLLGGVSDEWADYYKNLEKEDIKAINNFDETFIDGVFERGSSPDPDDLYFYGIKGGSKYLVDQIVPKYEKSKFPNDIFVIDCWPDTESKENDLIGLIKILKLYNIPILLTGHYPIKTEIQKMVDYYLFDKNNPLLTSDEFESHQVSSGRWSDMGNHRVDNAHQYHHDYAIWETMRNAFNFCKYLGKEKIHFFEYDNLPDEIQYRQAFLEMLGGYDAVLYEYHEGSAKDVHFAAYCATFIFSIKTDVAVKVIDQIKTKYDYFANKPKGWQLERVFLDCLRNVTTNIHMSRYIANNNELNTQAVWNRDGMFRNGGIFQVYPAVDNSGNLYVHLMSGFHEKPADKDYLLEIVYGSYTKFFNLEKGKFHTENVGRYRKGDRLRVYYQGVEVFNEFLGSDVSDFRNINKLTWKGSRNRKVNVNFVDGPFAEIIEDGDNLYNVQFIDNKSNRVLYNVDLRSNHWCKSSIRYYIDWTIRIKGIDIDFEYEYKLDLTDKRVLIGFESKSLGDTLAFMPYVEKFRQDRGAKVICSTFNNDLFKDQYPEIEFVTPGTITNNLFALYRLGMFYKTDNDGKRQLDMSSHPSDPKKVPLMKMASDILGLDYVELKPKLKKHAKKKVKRVSIAIHSTAQAKYWNNIQGWQDVTDFLISNGYEVRLLSREEDGFMGNRNPTGVVKQPSGPLKDVMKVLEESELFIGISSGLSWLSWAVGTPTMIISGFTDVDIEPLNGVCRIINKDVCNSCWNRFDFDPGDWNWCPVHKDTDRQFECSKNITSETVIEEIKRLLF